MATTAQDRLIEIHQSYSDAYARRALDLVQATTQAQAQQILQNVRDLESAYLLAAKQALDADGDAVELAYRDAQAARAEIDQAYQEAKAIGDKIRLAGQVVDKVTDLVKLAAKKD